MATRKPPKKQPRVGGGVRFHKGRRKPYEAVPSIEINGLKPKSKYFATEEEADAHLRRLHAAYVLGQLDVQVALPFGRFVEEMWLPAVKRGTYKPQTIKRYEVLWHIAQRGPVDMLRDLRLLTVDNMRRLEIWLAQEGYSRSTIDGVMWLMGSVFRYAISRELTTKNPVATLRASKLDRPALPAKGRRTSKWSTTQVRMFLDAIDGDPAEAFWLLIVTRLLRQAEVRSLWWQDWYREAEAIHVATSLSYNSATSWDRTATKSSQGQRHISVNERLRGALLRRQSSTPWCKPGDFIFTTPAGHPWTPDKPVADLESWCKRLALPRITPHYFRHIGNTVWDELGVPENVRHEASGHTPEMNRQYTHVVDTRIRAAYAALDQAFGT